MLSGELGHPRLHLRVTDSTNDRARSLALDGAPHGTLVTAGEQTAGRGRQGRSWSAPPGSSLLMSLIIRWPSPQPPPTLLALRAAVAVCDVLGADVLIKWPNDIVVGRGPDGSSARRGAEGQPTLAKLAGILIEGRPQERWALLGIGLNVAVRLEDLPEELQLTAATLGLGSDAIEPTLERLLQALTMRLGEPAPAILEAWRARDALIGREISWMAGTGRCQGIDGEGRLIVALGDGKQATLSAGEVHLTPS